ncbi:exodeoxyribonuclease VII large subunit [Rhabdochlamydiaceae symbiont of Dictyostelium giganteum]|uniref:exodeoxyribonuclease VII large subunit n=1 Tax=Rhabdochlamydiaceae symbiont of Dictyostelium giganteum TaxID=3342349 RepID=UPI00384E0769
MQPLTVSELTFSIKKQLETQFREVRVQGEITNFKEQTSGHLYFTLKDAEAQISSVLFRGNAQSLSRLPKNGDQVIVQGEVSVYAPRGNYQLIIRQLQFAGVGELLLRLHALKSKLEKLGWFDASKKKPLPPTPKTIGVITSPTGAVIQDILNILNRRHANFHLILNPVKVQGEGSAQEIAKAIDDFNKYKLADVLIVGRGGGSLEDLFAFNEEIVAEAIFRSQIPIISAVGHETDFSISDFVADLRAPTPSAAAELVMKASEERLAALQAFQKRMDQIILHTLKISFQKIELIKKHPLFASPYALLESNAQRLDDYAREIDTAMMHLLHKKTLSVTALHRQYHAINPKLRITYLKEKLSQISSHLKSIDPKNLLKKGYSMLFRENSPSVIVSSTELHPNDSIRIVLHDGQVKAKVYEI